MSTAIGRIRAGQAERLGRGRRAPAISIQARAAVLLGIGLFSIVALAWFAADQASLISDTGVTADRAALDDVRQLAAAATGQQTALQAYAATRDGSFLAGYPNEERSARAAVQDLQAVAGSRASRLIAAESAWQAWAAAFRTQVTAGPVDSGSVAQGARLFAVLDDAAQSLQLSLSREVDAREASAYDRRRADTIGLAAASAAAIVTLVVLIHMLLAQVVRPLWQLAGVAAQLAVDADAEVPFTDRRDEVGAVAHALLGWRYASAERLAMAKLAAESEARFRTVFDRAPIGICRFALSGRILDANPTLSAMIGYSSEELLRLSVTELSHPEDRERLRALDDRRADRLVIEKRVLKKDGTTFWGLMTVSLVRMDDGRPLFYVGMIEDITERKQHEAALSRRARTDALTGLANRAHFLEALETALADRRAPHTALFMLDLDGFKGVNDTLGHAAGDDLLRQVAQRLTEAMRSSDLVARLGGDEFAVLLPATGAEGADVAARKLLAALRRPFAVGDRRVEVGGSLGIALAPDHAARPAALLELADAAMYRAKRSGGGFVMAA